MLQHRQRQVPVLVELIIRVIPHLEWFHKITVSNPGLFLSRIDTSDDDDATEKKIRTQEASKMAHFGSICARFKQIISLRHCELIFHEKTFIDSDAARTEKK